MKPHTDYFDEKSERNGDYVFKKKYNSMVVLGYIEKSTGKIKSVSPMPTLLIIGLGLAGLILGIIPGIIVYGYFLVKAPGRVKEFREKLEAEKIWATRTNARKVGCQRKNSGKWI